MNRSKQRPGYPWSLHEALEAPPDRLMARLDVFQESIALSLFQDGKTTTRMVSALDVAQALTREAPISSGILPEGAVWWGNTPHGPSIAVWQPPRVRRVALQLEALKPPERLELPLPGFVFVCQPGPPPWVYAAKRRPSSMDDPVYHAPLFNVFASGLTCAGSHQYPMELSQIPDSFFASFFTREGDRISRSKVHGADVHALWQSLRGKEKYPLDDLVEFGPLAKALMQ